MDNQTIIDTATSMGIMVIYLFVIVAMVAFMMTITDQQEPSKEK